MLIRYLHGEGHTIDWHGERYIWNYQGNGDTVEMPDDAAQELLDSLSGADFEEAQPTEEAKPAAPTQPVPPANKPTTFGPALTSQFVTNPNPAVAPPDEQEGGL